MKALFKPIAMLLLVGALLLSMTAIASADGSQFWKLDSETTAAGQQMEKVGGPDTSGQSGNVSIAADSSVIWIADQAAEVNVTFAPGDWTTNLCLVTGWANDCDVELGRWNGTAFSKFTTTKPVEVAWDANKNELTVMAQTTSETIEIGDYLALQVSNGDSVEHFVKTAGCSYLSSPCTDPSYPTPELAAGVLLGLGLLVMGGFVLIAKRRRTAALI